MARKDAEKSGLELEAARQDTAFRVFRAYLEALTSETRLKAAEKALEEARENMRLAAVRTAAGAGLRSDELRARTHQSRMEQQLIKAGNDITLARMRLALLTGFSESQTFDLEPAPALSAIPQLNEELVTSAMEDRVDMKSFRSDLGKSEAAVQLARSGYYPAFDAFASYQRNSRETPFAADNDAWTAGVSLKWQLFEGFRSSYERGRAAAARSAAREVLESRSKDVRYQLKESFLRREEAGKQVEVARNALLDAEEAVRLIAKRFENSLATMVELLDAQTALNQARTGLLETEAAYALAGGQTHYAAGTFLKEMLK